MLYCCCYYYKSSVNALSALASMLLVLLLLLVSQSSDQRSEAENVALAALRPWSGVCYSARLGVQCAASVPSLSQCAYYGR